MTEELSVFAAGDGVEPQSGLLLTPQIDLVRDIRYPDIDLAILVMAIEPPRLEEHTAYYCPLFMNADCECLP